jgi:hypothetical protein
MTKNRKLLTGTIMALMLGAFAQGCADPGSDDSDDDTLAQAAPSLDGAVITPTADAGKADGGAKDGGADAGKVDGGR